MKLRCTLKNPESSKFSFLVRWHRTGETRSGSYLEDHVQDVICGPLSLSECMDLSGSGCTLTLTCPYLVEEKVKSVIILLRLTGALPPDQQVKIVLAVNS
jgi:hypothetical protein